MPDHDILIIDDPAPSEPMTAEQAVSLREWFTKAFPGSKVALLQLPWRARDILVPIGFRGMRNMVVRHYVVHCVRKWAKAKHPASPVRWPLSAR